MQHKFGFLSIVSTRDEVSDFGTDWPLFVGRRSKWISLLDAFWHRNVMDGSMWFLFLYLKAKVVNLRVPKGRRSDRIDDGIGFSVKLGISRLLS